MKFKLAILISVLSAMLLSRLSAQTVVRIESLQITNVGDGQLYAQLRDSSEALLNGKVRITTGIASEHLDAEFAKGYAENRWSYYHDNELISYVTYKNGYLEGECGELFANGIPQEIGFYRAGKKDGIWKLFNSNGSLKLSEEYVEGDKRKQISYYSDGSIRSEANFLSGEEHGTQKYYDKESGRLMSEKNFENGKRVGHQMQYYPDGDYIQISNYSILGVRDGKYREIYDKDYKLRTEGRYNDGRRDGVWKYGSKDGKITKEEKYDKGKLIETKKFEK